MNDKTKWLMLSSLAGGLAAYAAREALGKTWEKVAKEEVPEAQPDPKASHLMLWAGLSALVVALAQSGARLGVTAISRRGDENAMREKPKLLK